jgi:hypothetical protein
VEKFGRNFSANDYSEPDGMVLSSAAMVTAAETVQDAGRRVRKMGRVEKSWKEKIGAVPDGTRIYFLRAPGTAGPGFLVPPLGGLFHLGSRELRMWLQRPSEMRLYEMRFGEPLPVWW